MNLNINGKPATKKDVFLVDPSKLTLITDKEHNLFDARVNMSLDDAFVANITAFGVKEPILVHKEGEKLIVVAGRQRTRAAIEANKLLKKQGQPEMNVPIILENGDEKDLFSILVFENAARVESTPMERAKQAKRLLDFGKTEEEISVILAKPVSHIRQLMSLFDCAPEVRKEVESGRLSVSGAAKLAKIEDKKEQVETLREAEKAHEAAKSSGKGHKSAKKIAVRHVKAKAEAKRGVKPRGTRANASNGNDVKLPNEGDIKALLVAGNLPKPAQEALAWVIEGAITGCIMEGKKVLKALADKQAEAKKPLSEQEGVQILNARTGTVSSAITKINSRS